MSAAPVAIVTGASVGIGRATALLLAREGYRVFATVRTEEAESSLRAATSGANLDVLRADMADPDAVARIVPAVRERGGRVDVLVNNAGYAQLGAVEDLPREVARRQFEVNVLTPVHLCREVLPLMRAQGSGRIVNVSSLAGRVSVPLMGAYCASKFALEAFTDALRVETHSFGVRAIVIEPGPVATRFQRTALTESRGILESPSVYTSVYASYLKEFEKGGGATAERVARVILHAIRARRPRARYRVRWRDTLAAGITQVVPRGAMDWALSRVMGLQAPGSQD